MSALAHPRLLGNLKAVFPGRCTIQSKTVTPDQYGAPSETWTTVAANIPCSIAPMVVENIRAYERTDDDKTVSLNPHRITLRGRWPQVATSMRAVVEGVAWDINGVEHDSQGVYTRLVATEAR